MHFFVHTRPFSSNFVVFYMFSSVTAFISTRFWLFPRHVSSCHALNLGGGFTVVRLAHDVFLLQRRNEHLLPAHGTFVPMPVRPLQLLVVVHGTRPYFFSTNHSFVKHHGPNQIPSVYKFITAYGACITHAFVGRFVSG